MAETENSLAVFLDFENLALGFEGRHGARFDIQKVLDRLVEKGKIIVKRAYADWGRFREYRTSLHEAAIELIEIPRRSMTGKNSADIRLVVDAMDLSYSKEHVHTFVIISGDSDFSPLVSKLKENGKHVIGLGMRNSTSDLLIDNCDEFIFYEDLDRPASAPQANEMAGVPTDKRKVFALLMDAVTALRRENKEIIWSSMVKDTIKRKKPQFNESYYGYRTFSNLLEDGQKYGLISLTTDPRSGTYVVSEAGTHPHVPAAGPGNGAAERRQESQRGHREEGSREDRWSRRRGRSSRGRYEERGGEGAWSNGQAAGRPEPGYGMRGAEPLSYDEAGQAVVEGQATPLDAAQAGSASFVETPDESAVIYRPPVEAVPADEAEAAGGGAGPDVERDDYGFPSYDAPRSAGEFAEARDESLAAAAPPPEDETDDRTPEEREMDARAAAMAHSHEIPASPSAGKKTGGRTRAGAAGRGRRPGGVARAAAPGARGGAGGGGRARRDSGTGARGRRPAAEGAAPAKPRGGGRTRRGPRKSS